VPRPRKISDIKPLFTNLAQSSHFLVRFGGLSPELLSYLRKKGVDSSFIREDVGLLCFSAQLPTSSLATAEITGNFMGIQEKFAHTRIYSPINLEFYIDKQYKTVKFLEHWMEFIASGSHNTIGLPGENKQINQNITNYFSRMQYPTYYKTNATRIFKFDRDYKNYLEYNFVGLFPLNMSSIQVGYNASSILTASVTFQYDRYIPGKTYTIAEVIGDSNNKDLTSRSSRATSGPTSDQEIKNQSLRQGFVNTPIPTQTVFNTPLLNVTKVAFGGDLNLF
jgi:hypothetical protein